MDFKEILSSKDEFTKEELQLISSCLLSTSTALTDTIFDLKKQLFTNEYEVNSDIFYFRRCKFAIDKLHSRLCEFLRNGGNNNEM